LPFDLQWELLREVESSAPGSSTSSSGRSNTDTTELEARAIFMGRLEVREARQNQKQA